MNLESGTEQLQEKAEPYDLDEIMLDGEENRDRMLATLDKFIEQEKQKQNKPKD